MRRDFESTKYEKICGAKKVKKIPPRTCVGDISLNYALSTLPDLRQEAQTYIFLAPPLAVLTLTDFTLDFHILLDLLWE